MNNNKKLLYSSVGIIIIAIVVNLTIWINSRENKINANSESTGSLSKISDDTWREAGINPDDVNVIKMEMVNMIEDVIVEKNPVCSGEDFIINVKAQNIEGKTNTLTYRIAGKKGNPVVMNYRATGEKNIHVFVRDNIKTLDHKVVSVQVIDCPNKPMALLKSNFSTSILNEVDYEVEQMQGMEGHCTYHWDFGDGKTARSKIGSISHNYGDREQKSYTSTFMAKVTIIDQKGETIVARKDVTFPNVQWISTKMGLPVFPIIHDRIASFKDGEYYVNIKMKNIFDLPISLHNANVTFVPCSLNISKESLTYSIGDFIRKTYLNPGEFAEDILRFNKDILPYPTCTLSMKIIGQLSNKKEVSAPIYINIPMSAESIKDAIGKNRARVVTDGVEIEKVKRAKRILGKDIVTPDDIAKLERQGKL